MNKKVFTFLFTAVATVLAFGQPAPVVVKGLVNNLGQLKSKGDVHLRAAGTAGIAGEIINNGHLVLENGIIFASDDNFDGLLYNNFAQGATVSFNNLAATYNKVKVEKTYETGDWVYITFPFDVCINDITPDPANNFTQWELNTDPNLLANAPFYMQKPSAKRTETGDPADQWETITNKNEILKAGVGYTLYINRAFCNQATTATLTFPAYSQTTVGDLYNSGDKDLPYVYFHSLTDHWTPGTNSVLISDLSWGWYALGTMHTHNYEVNPGHLSINSLIKPIKQIYYFDWTVGWRIRNIEYEPMKVSPFVPIIVHGAYNNPADRLLLTSTEVNYPITASVNGITFEGADYRKFSQKNQIPNYFKLIFQANNSDLSDELWVTEAEEEKDVNDLRMGEDALKLFSGKNALSEFYTLINATPLSINRMHLIDQDIPLGMKLINEADFTIEMAKFSGFEGRNIYLLDKERGVEQNLSESAYTFHAGAGINNDRFVIRVTSDPTAINNLVESNIKAWAKDRSVFVQGVEKGDNITIYDLTGKLVLQNIAANNEVSYPLRQTGVFVVKVNGSNNFVAKIINK
ncbi:MAG: T9SS type A sorting domain-containing protein [Dysgonamonadaceae bacterium]|jgi:hypothetical protein|nr:T9SS type A sorting domain-containing protein [Dysgonamonadaceae bacterium]